jgi:4-amino-4-deoxy-L-arabinose transferase-like glycosyltransferase
MFSLLHFVHLRADPPSQTRWIDPVQFTDEGWYSSAATRETLTGHWYLRGDFNPGVSAPVWPFLEWIEFRWTGATIESARTLAGLFFIADLFLAYGLFRRRAPEWATLLGLTFIVTSPFIFCFLRNATLEPILVTTTLLAMNAAIRVGSSRHPLRVSALTGLLFTLMMLAKPMAIYALPALGVLALWPLLKRRALALRCFLSALTAFALSYGLWLAMVCQSGLWRDYLLIFKINAHATKERLWLAIGVLKLAYYSLMQDYILVPLAVIMIALLLFSRRWKLTELLRSHPATTGCLAVVLGYFFYGISEDQSSYHVYVVSFVFLLLALAQMIAACIGAGGWLRKAGFAALGISVFAIGANAATVVRYTLTPQYTFQNAADGIAAFIERHPDGSRLLVSPSADNITLYAGLPGLNDHYGTVSLEDKLRQYHPGWYAEWNQIPSDVLGQLHRQYFLEQVASFDAFDDPYRRHLVLYRLLEHPYLDAGLAANLEQPMPGDRILVPVLDPALVPKERVRLRLTRWLRSLLH